MLLVFLKFAFMLTER